MVSWLHYFWAVVRQNIMMERCDAAKILPLW
jgi:hypothetical protein